MADEKFVVITPARNEAKYLGRTIESLVSQSLLPSEWVIVDDGSVDNTYRLAEDAARGHPWIKVIRRPDRGYRDFSGNFVEGIYEGLNHVSEKDYQYIFKIDADILLGPDYFKNILAKFAENPKLGIGGGMIYEYIYNKKFRIGGLPEIIPGAIKCWRRKCFQEIGGLVRESGWDVLDCFKAMGLGWQVQTYADDELKVLHLRPEKSSIKNRYHGWARDGKIHHFIGAHPLWVLASASYHVVDRPFALGSFCMIIGYLRAFLEGCPQYEDQGFRRYLRAYQKKRLTEILRLKWLPGT
jgi:glycosyltransferase involved in cell wall biosynthesis